MPSYSEMLHTHSPSIDTTKASETGPLNPKKLQVYFPLSAGCGLVNIRTLPLAMALEGREVEPTLDQTTGVLYPAPTLQVSVNFVPGVTVSPGPDTDGVTGGKEHVSKCSPCPYTPHP